MFPSAMYFIYLVIISNSIYLELGQVWWNANMHKLGRNAKLVTSSDRATIWQSLDKNFI